MKKITAFFMMLLIFSVLPLSPFKAALASAGEKTPEGAVKLEEGLFIGFLWPLKGTESSQYGNRTDPISTDITVHHSGVDLAAPDGTMVSASKSGRILFAGITKDYGNLVMIQHDNKMETRYGHLSTITVKKGQFVRPGQVLGTVGTTGRSTGAHLHFEIRKDGRTLNPAKWLVPEGFMMPRSFSPFKDLYKTDWNKRDAV